MSTAALALLAAAEVGSGRISGGWEFVWASYALTWATFAGYGLYLWLRRPGASASSGGLKDQP